MGRLTPVKGRVPNAFLTAWSVESVGVLELGLGVHKLEAQGRAP